MRADPRVTVITPGYAGSRMFRDLVERRHLVWLLTYRSFRARYKQALLGVAWAFINPLAYAVIFYALFSLTSLPSSRNADYFYKVLAAMALWQFFARSLVEASSSLSGNVALISKVYFPRQVLPLSAILATLVDLLINLVILAAVFGVAGIAVPGWRLLLVPLAVFWALVLAYGLSLATSALEAIYRDVRHAMPLAVQLGLFVSPVAYAVSDVPERYQFWVALNPMAPVMELMRAGLFAAQPVPSLAMALPGIAVTALLFFLGTGVFSRTEAELVDKA